MKLKKLTASPPFRPASLIRKQPLVAVIVLLSIASCSVPKAIERQPAANIPASFNSSKPDSSLNIAAVPWRRFFTDANLTRLIDTALKNNQELQITLQEIEIARSEVRARQGLILPSVTAVAGVGVDKVGRYTSQGAGDKSTDITPGREVPDLLPDYRGGLVATWEVDIWNKLHAAKGAAVSRYLATVEGKNFVLTNLVAEVATSYYELLSLDNQLDIVRQNIQLQKTALEMVKVQKEAARVTELAVQKFAAEVSRSQTIENELLQRITETENRVNLLLGRYPQPVLRSKVNLVNVIPATVPTGLPSQLLANRADIRQQEDELMAANLDVKVARAEFLPSFGLRAGLGVQAFKPSYLLKMPESILFNLAGDLAAPLINKSAIKAEFAAANARQLQALYEYERTVLNAYLDVATGLSNIENLKASYANKAAQVEALNRSISISNDLFAAARADYLEVLTSQRDVLEAKLELVENREQQLNAVVKVYRDLGGGWQ